jgi:hypothetical protein
MESFVALSDMLNHSLTEMFLLQRDLMKILLEYALYGFPAILRGICTDIQKGRALQNIQILNFFYLVGTKSKPF